MRRWRSPLPYQRTQPRPRRLRRTGVSPSGSGTSVTPTSSAPTSTGPFIAMTYPSGGPADCKYGGEFSQIKATDEHTVEFTLCYPDPAFLAKLAFASNEIHDTASLEADMANHLILAKPNGTGPYMLDQWQRGDHISLKANPNYWGEKAKAANLEFRWNAESAARLVELQAGTVDGIDNPGPNDMDTISSDTEPAAPPARGAEHVLHRLQRTPMIRGATRRCARPSRWASTGSASSTTSTRRGPRSRRTSRPARSLRVRGRGLVRLRRHRREADALRRGLPGRLRHRDLLPRRRPGLPPRPERSWPRTSSRS